MFHRSDRDDISRINTTTSDRHQTRLNSPEAQAEMVNTIVNRTRRIEPNQRPSQSRSQIPASRQENAERTQVMNEHNGVYSMLVLPVGCLDQSTALISMLPDKNGAEGRGSQ